MAGGAITTGNHPKAIWPGVKEWFGTKYDEEPEEWPDLFEVKPSNKSYEEFVGSHGFGLASVKNQGQGVDMASHSQVGLKRMTNVVYALGFVTTREEEEDNQYKELAMQRSEALAFSMRQTKENVHANVINRWVNTSYTGWDAKPLLATDHPVAAGTQSNYLDPAADISEAALEDVLIMVMTAKDYDGLQIALKPRSLCVPPNNYFEAHRIVDSVLQNDTANNAVNVIKATNSIPEGVRVNHYFTDTDIFFIKTNCPLGFISLSRRGREFTMDNDFLTENRLHKATERYVPSWVDWRCCFGSVGA